MVPGAFAQTTETYYVDLVHGADDDACDWNNPCTLSRAWAQLSNRERVFIRVRRAGGTVQVPAPTSLLTKSVDFGTYAEGSASAVEGTLIFTGNLKIAPEGQFGVYHDKGKVQFEDITLEAGARSKNLFSEKASREGRIAITGTLTIPDGETAALHKFVVTESFTVKGTASRFRITDSLAVHRGATLSLDDVDLVVYVRNGLTVDGAIKDVTKGTSRPVRMAALNLASGDGNRGHVSSNFFRSHRYWPSRGVGQNNCKRIQGTGTIPAGIFVIAMGNVCVNLKRVGPVTVSGSLANDVFTKHKVTTDLIFREDVIVDGDVAQWNDSRILFEKTATIHGDMILRDGGLPYTNTTDYGEGNLTTSIRRGAPSNNPTGSPIRSGEKYTCEYLIEKRRPDFQEGATHQIPGVQFAGEVTIAGDLAVHSTKISETTSHASDQTMTSCAPRVLFLAPFLEDDAKADIHLVSSVGRSLVIEDTVSFGGKGRVYLDSHAKTVSGTARRTVHSLRVGSDLAAGGKTIGMAHPSTSSIDGMCTGKDISLTFGNHLVLTDAAESVVVGDATSGLTLDALMTLGDLRVEPDKGPLTVTTLHVGSGAELMASKDVKVTESLILQGELSGELDEASTIKTLTYGNRNTDLVKKAALVPMLDALSIHIGRGELRLDEMVQTKTLGLCSGTLSLMDVESTTDSTLHVTEQITVQNGMLAKDTNDPGSISTDKATTASTDDRYILKYVTPGPHTVTDALEWFDPRDVIVDHAKAEITVTGDRSLMGKLTVSRGKLMVDGELMVGTSALHRDSATNVDNYSTVVTAGELHTKGQNVVVHGKVTVSGKSKLVTGGGDLHVLGRVSKGKYIGETAQVTIEKEAVINLGAGTLMLGPEDTAKRDNLENNRTTPQVDLVLTGKLLADTLHVPGGSKRTHIVSKCRQKPTKTVFPRSCSTERRLRTTS